MELTKINSQFNHSLFGSLTTITNNNGDIFFVGKEVCEILGYSNPSKTISDHCKGYNKMLLPSNGGEQEFIVIPERDLYRLIMKSKKQEAEKFEEWVVGEVLPAIRKNGSYIHTPSTYLDALKALVKSEEEKQSLLLQVDNMQQVMDSHTDWVSILKVSQFNNVSEKIFSWRVLKNKSIELGYLVKKVQSVRFDYQNIYHVNVWRAAYPRFNYNFNEDTNSKLVKL
jgi:prophage antirepressor-like protein